MTEVKASKETGASLFATKDYAIGDTILQEDIPLIKLAPASSEEEEKLLAVLKDSSSKKGKLKDDKPSFWTSIVVPSEVPGDYHGKFKGMVHAALCYANLDTSSDSKKDFFQLYCPAAPEESSEDEKTIIEVATHALRYLKEHVHVDEKRKDILDDEDTMRKVMLIWSCNAFDGGRVYDRISRINHSCNPNAVVQKGELEDQQIIKAVVPISAGEEITISYLGMLLYADRSTRRGSLHRTKHFVCQCERCTVLPDKAFSIPCPSCHPRVSGQRQLDEDVQYDDEHTVRYAWPKDPTKETLECETCRAIFSKEDKEFKIVLNAAQQVTEKVASFLQDYESCRNHRRTDDEDDEDDTLQQELREQHLRIASSVLGARHWATNLMLMLELDQKLQGFHADLLTEGKDPDLETIAEIIDMLERVCRFVDDLRLKQHRGHLLSDIIVGVARALVSLGDVKSQKYAAEWLGKLDDYVERFESEGMQKVCNALKVAWTRNDDSTSEPPSKRGKTS